MEKLSKREKVMIGLGLVGATAAGYFGFKYYDTKKNLYMTNQSLDIANKALEFSNNKAKDLEERLNFIEFLVIESECIPKALQNGNNKLSRVQSKIAAQTERLLLKPDDIQTQKALSNNKVEEAKLLEHIAKALKLDEAVKADQNIYAK